VAAAPAQAPAPVAAPQLTEPLWLTNVPDVTAPAPAPVSDVAAELARQAAEAARLRIAHERAEAEIAALRASLQAPAPAPAPVRKRLSEAIEFDKLTGGNVDPDTLREVAVALDPAIEALLAARMAEEVAPLQARLVATDQATAQQKQRTFEDAAFARVPHLKRIIDDPRFKTFLSTEVPHVGSQFVDAYNRHLETHNVDGVAWVAEQFAQYTRSGAAPLAALAETPRVGNQTTAQAVPQAATFTPDSFAGQVAALRRKFQSRSISGAEFSRQLGELRNMAMGTGAQV
jgi:hypothetical protein